jgi:ribosomal protein S18 acetylase RimI-like enzyme
MLEKLKASGKPEAFLYAKHLVFHRKHKIAAALGGSCKAYNVSVMRSCWTIEFGGLGVQLDEIYLQPEQRGLGLASQAIIALREQSRSRGTALRMKTTPDNFAAQRLYQRLGFAPSGRPVYRMEF